MLQRYPLRSAMRRLVARENSILAIGTIDHASNQGMDGASARNLERVHRQGCRASKPNFKINDWPLLPASAP
jgi:hypothetical protein